MSPLTGPCGCAADGSAAGAATAGAGASRASLIARNVAGLLSRPIAIAIAASALFAAAHYPRIELVVLTGVASLLIFWMRRAANLNVGEASQALPSASRAPLSRA